MWRLGLTLGLVCLLDTGCVPLTDEGGGSTVDDSTPVSPEAAEDPAGSRPHDDRVLPPDDWTPLARAAHRRGPAILCVEFDGAVVDADESFIVRRGNRARVPPFDARSYGVASRGEAIAYVLLRVRRFFAETALAVTETCPADAAHTRVLVGGTPDLVGEDDSVAGIAPFDVGNAFDDDIGFAFAASLGQGRGRADLDQLAAVIAHEAGHTFGLDHVRPPADLMHPTVNDDMLGFTAAETLDGHWQDAPAMLAIALGAPAAEPPPEADTPPFDCDPPSEVSGDRRDRAAELAPGVPAGGQACDTDEDWFLIDAASGDTLDVELAYPDEGWVEPPALFRPRARTPTGTATSEDGVHHLTAHAEVAGRYRLRVTTSDAVPWRYALRVRITPAP